MEHSPPGFTFGAVFSDFVDDAPPSLARFTLEDFRVFFEKSVALFATMLAMVSIFDLLI